MQGSPPRSRADGIFILFRPYSLLLYSAYSTTSLLSQRLNKFTCRAYESIFFLAEPPYIVAPSLVHVFTVLLVTAPLNKLGGELGTARFCLSYSIRMYLLTWFIIWEMDNTEFHSVSGGPQCEDQPLLSPNHSPL